LHPAAAAKMLTLLLLLLADDDVMSIPSNHQVLAVVNGTTDAATLWPGLPG